MNEGLLLFDGTGRNTSVSQLQLKEENTNWLNYRCCSTKSRKTVMKIKF